jgi:hypothetical protein
MKSPIIIFTIYDSILYKFKCLRSNDPVFCGLFLVPSDSLKCQFVFNQQLRIFFFFNFKKIVERRQILTICTT